jgi:hypothetical protein
MADKRAIVVGLLATRDDRELAQALAAGLPEALRELLEDGAGWRTEVVETDPADAAASPSELVDAVRRRLLDRGWKLGIGLTALPLRAGRRPVASHASASHGVGLVSIPALGAVHREARLREAAVQVVTGLLGRGDGVQRRGAELASAITPADARRHGTLRFTGLAIGANLRLLLGMIRANRPTRVMARLSRSASAALGTGAYAVTSSNLWTVSDLSGWPRLIGVGLLAIGLILIALIVAHGLWERARDPSARERVVLFNVVTVTTLAIGVVTLYLVLFATMLFAAVVMIPPGAFKAQVGHAPNVLAFVRLGWFAASVATVGGAFGSLIESDAAVRDAAYRRHCR